LISSVLKDKEECCIYIVYGFVLWKKYSDAVKESDRIDPPRNITIQKQWRNEKKAKEVVNKKRFLANGVPSIYLVLNIDIDNIEQNSEQ
jgi:hypothetical protein